MMTNRIASPLLRSRYHRHGGRSMDPQLVGHLVARRSRVASVLRQLSVAAVAFALLVIAREPAAAQVHRVTGRVTNTEGAVLGGVTVQVQGTEVGALTNAEGVFALNAPNPTGTLIFSM